MLWIPAASSAALVSCAPCARPLLPSEGAARRRVQVVTPTGQIRRLYASAVAVRTPGGCCAAGDWRGVVRTAQMFVGLPYLWGGRSGFGLNCSGLTSLDYRAHGATIPEMRTLKRTRTRRWRRAPCDPATCSSMTPADPCITLRSSPAAAAWCGPPEPAARSRRSLSPLRPTRVSMPVPAASSADGPGAVLTDPDPVSGCPPVSSPWFLPNDHRAIVAYVRTGLSASSKLGESGSTSKSYRTRIAGLRISTTARRSMGVPITTTSTSALSMISSISASWPFE